jgi:hypothetical protein
MSTHASITIYMPGPDSFETSYVQFDGYLMGVGKRLLTYSNDYHDVQDLVGLGDLRSLGGDLAGCRAYHRDLGWKWEDCKPRTYRDLSDIPLWEYNYVFIGDRWYLMDDEGTDGKRRLRPLKSLFETK